MTLVSVVVPTDDRAEFLPAAVDSVLDQTHRRVECVVVDGGSTDGTREYLAGIADERVRAILHDRPHGLANARNAGIDLASGEYVCFLDDDDRLHPGAVETLLGALAERPAECASAFAGHRRIDPRGITRVRPAPDGR